MEVVGIDGLDGQVPGIDGERLATEGERDGLARRAGDGETSLTVGFGAGNQFVDCRDIGRWGDDESGACAIRSQSISERYLNRDRDRWGTRLTGVEDGGPASQSGALSINSDGGHIALPESVLVDVRESGQATSEL